MAIKISGTTVIDDSRNVDNIGTACATCWFGDGSNITGIAGNPLILTPINTSPADGATNIGDGPTLCASSYSSLYGITMCCSQWQVDDNSDFSSPVFNLCCSGTSTSVTLGAICPNCTYYWRVRYFDNCGCCSDYSNSTCFTTCATFGPTTLGESFGGGFYTGTICAAGSCYYLIVAPNSTGCRYGCAWKTTRTASGVCGEADRNVNGYNNTYTYLNNASHPAANFTATRTIGGFTDWYLPAICEVRQLYLNRCCMPAGEGYGFDALRLYWSSTEPTGAAALNNACGMCVCTGEAFYTGKEGTFVNTRAIRRIPF